MTDKTVLHSFTGSNQAEIDRDFAAWTIIELKLRAESKAQGKIINELLTNVGWKWNDSKTINPLRSIFQVFAYNISPEHKYDQEVMNGIVEDLDYVLTEMDYELNWTDNGYEISR